MKYELAVIILKMYYIDLKRSPVMPFAFSKHTVYTYCIKRKCIVGF